MNEPANLHVHFRYSRIACAMTLLGVVATSALVAWLPAEAWQRLLVVAALGAYGIVLVRSWAQRTTGSAVQAIVLGADRRIVLIERGGRRVEGEVRADSYVGSVLTTIVWRGDGARCTRAIAILPDMLPADDLRNLRLLLRLGRPLPVTEHAATPAATTPAHR